MTPHFDRSDQNYQDIYRIIYKLIWIELECIYAPYVCKKIINNNKL